MTGLLVLVAALSLEEADRLAAAARAAEGAARAAATERALQAYDAILRERPKDRRLVPKVRRRRAALLAAVGRAGDALAEHDRILAGRARRRDKARALHDGGRLLEKAGDFHAAERRLARVAKEYRDVTSVLARAQLSRGRVLTKMERRAEAEAAYRFVLKRCRDEPREIVSAYDALAILAVEAGDAARARRWLKECVKRYGKRAARPDRYGAFLSRQLGAMRAPKRLAELEDP